MELYGNPPQFPDEEEEAIEELKASDEIIRDKTKGKKVQTALECADFFLSITQNYRFVFKYALYIVWTFGDEVTKKGPGG